MVITSSPPLARCSIYGVVDGSWERHTQSKMPNFYVYRNTDHDYACKVYRTLVEYLGLTAVEYPYSTGKVIDGKEEWAIEYYAEARYDECV